MFVLLRYTTFGLFWLLSALAAHATPEDYCAAYARDFADQGPQAQHQERSDNALADCLLTVSPTQAEPVVQQKSVVVTPKRLPTQPVAKIADTPKPKLTKPILQPGSIAWLNYCDKKYASFDRATGNYTSYKGIERKCLVTAE